MEIKSFQKTSLIDYPGEICSVVFTPGCNMRCRYCHNKALVLNAENLPVYSEEHIINHLQKRISLIDALCITGGEPTLQNDLKPFIEKVNYPTPIEAGAYQQGWTASRSANSR